MKDNIDLIAKDVVSIFNKLRMAIGFHPVCTITLHSKLLHITHNYGYPLADLLIFATDDVLINDVSNINFYYDMDSADSVKGGLMFYNTRLH